MDYEKIENLALLSKKGDVSSKETLIKEFTPFILNLSKKSYVNGYEYEDLKNECYATLFKALEAYDQSKHRFVAYAVNAIKNSINTLIRNSMRKEVYAGGKTLNLEDNLDQLPYYHLNSVEDKLYKIEFSTKFKAAIGSLTQEEQDLINALFYKNYTLKQHASVRGIPYGRANYMKICVLKKLKRALEKEEYYRYEN